MTHAPRSHSTSKDARKATGGATFRTSLLGTLLTIAGVALLSSVGLSAASMDAAVKLRASDGSAGDNFGVAHSIFGNTLVVGAYFADHVAEDAGAAFVFERDITGGWTETQKLTASDAAAGDLFGNSIYLDADLLAIGAIGGLTTHPGAVYVFERQQGLWVESAKITAPAGDIGDMFGWSVARFENTLLIAAFNDDDLGTNTGAVHAFELVDESWVHVQTLHASDAAERDCFGSALRVSGTRAAIGAYYDDDMGDLSGSVYIFEHDGSKWNEVQKLLASDGLPKARFGASLELERDVLVVSAYRDSELAQEAGAVYIFDHDGAGFWETEKLTAPAGEAFDHFGLSVAYAQGRLIVGAPQDDSADVDAGSAYLYTRSAGGFFGDPEELIAPDGAAGDFFGFASSLRGATAIISGHRDDDLGVDSGSVYVVDVDFGLSAAGICPGEVEIRIAEAAANGSVTLLASMTEGPGIVANGPCVGVATGLVDAQILATVIADDKGAFSFLGSLAGNVCGYRMQAVDLLTCEVTEVVRIP